MNTVLNAIRKIGIMPAAVLDDVSNAVPLADALCRGGIPCAEIAFCGEAAEESIHIMTEKFPQMTIGSGTVLTAEQACRAANAGADFIVTPVFDPAVIQCCIDRNIPVIPRISGSDDVETALSLGLEAVSFLSGRQADDANMLQTMFALYPGMKFIPEGGLPGKEAGSYLASDNVLACVSSGIAKQEWIQSGEFSNIRLMAKETVRVMMGFEVSHIGINCSSSEEAEETAETFETMFGFPKESGSASVYAGTFLECMKPPHLGTNGHIAITVNSIIRAKDYFEAIGYEFNEASAKFNNGRMIVIYFKEEIGGFAVHIVQK